jgi:hypothetical protein
MHSQECGFAVRNSPPKRGERASEGIHEAMRPGWLARAAFIYGLRKAARVIFGHFELVIRF